MIRGRKPIQSVLCHKMSCSRISVCERVVKERQCTPHQTLIAEFRVSISTVGYLHYIAFPVREWLEMDRVPKRPAVGYIGNTYSRLGSNSLSYSRSIIPFGLCLYMSYKRWGAMIIVYNGRSNGVQESSADLCSTLQQISTNINYLITRR